MNRNEIYLVISGEDINPSLTFGEGIRQTIGAAINFRKAYDLALSIGDIQVPSLSYKACLRRVQSDMAFSLGCKVSSAQVTIALIKKW
jgi:hypothetical protein